MATSDEIRSTIVGWRTLTQQHSEHSPRILIAASFTAEPVAPGLGTTLHGSSGTVASIEFLDYNQLFQLCLDPGRFAAEEFDEIVIMWRLEDVFERDLHAWGAGDGDARNRILDGATSLGAAVANLATGVPASIIVSDAMTPIGFGLDHHDPNLLTELSDLQMEANRAFDEALGDEALGKVKVDRLRLAALQHVSGTASSFDRRSWLMYRQPFTEGFALMTGSAIAEVMAARTRTPPKVVVLDCDDTLWAGTIADDGVGSLECGDAFPGFAFRSFQLALGRLRHQGVLLALASKNEPEAVAQAFSDVDSMVLTDEDIAARRVSWDPKPAALVELAHELNLGLDSFVFVDDSDYEIGAMRTQLPAVVSIKVPDEIEQLPDLLAEAGLFRMIRVTGDDRLRTQRMQVESRRAGAATTMSHSEFLMSLELRVRLIRVGPGELGRTAQLTNKTNQFNATTVRRSETEIASLLDDPDCHVHAVAADDRFGEYGIIGVVISRWVVDRWQFDTVLMSCRVLGRGVETAMLAGVVADLRADRPGAVHATYIDSGRNKLVAALFPDHGFAPVGQDGTEFVLAAESSIGVPPHITLTGP